MGDHIYISLRGQDDNPGIGGTGIGPYNWLVHALIATSKT
jgi:hypothetical protein